MRRDENEKMMGPFLRQGEPFVPQGKRACEEWAPLLVLLAAGSVRTCSYGPGEELDAAEEERVAGHVAECAACSAALEREKELLALLAEHRKNPDAPLLAECRANLEDALDREEERGWLGQMAGVVFGWNRTAKWGVNWLAAGTSWSAAVLLAIGFSAGVLGPRLLRHPAVPALRYTAPFVAQGEQGKPAAQNGAADATGNSGSNANANAGTNSDGSASREASAAGSHSVVSALDLPTADLAGINVMPPDGNDLPQVRLQLQAREPVTLEGNVNDDNVEQVLLYMLNDNARFCSGARLDAVDLLRARNSDPKVRTALCHTVHVDHDAAVRLKALEALNGSDTQDPGTVLQTVLDALESDQNPGVRIEAVDTLRDMAAKGQVTSDDRALAVLRERMAKDPDTYIRAQSAAAIQELGPHQKF
ncbi:MAG: HEAT repeat domain-containing protein [Candidatus Acidiferrales bacterium]